MVDITDETFTAVTQTSEPLVYQLESNMEMEMEVILIHMCDMVKFEGDLKQSAGLRRD
ncbi:unnamed protein product [Dovyalis caffra]|uniref:Uncharacterized protein n=1 Tax=Dovyalis caffra TaxID=77055 RepID=A0AAV1SLC3_9ROSI|nr:unnamed protein product [Dovyalis caffra]